MGSIRDVWAPNFEAEMRTIRDVVEKYPFIAMDTEFPGVVARPIGSFKTSSDYHYQTMRCNVDLLKIIQMGITFADEEGNYPMEGATWQFNFKFSINDDMYSPESIEYLQKAGLDFQKHEEFGIVANDFAELIITSGMVLTPETKWISYHSGYDFGYFVKLLTAESLPTTEEEFFKLLHLWFHTVYDLKFLMRSAQVMKGTLQELADDLGIQRTGDQTGADSLIVSSSFFATRRQYFSGIIVDADFNGKLYGLGQTFASPNGLTESGRGGTTIAEREDRGSLFSSTRGDAQGQTQGQPPQNPNVNVVNHAAQMAMAPMPGGMPASVSYGLGGNGPYMRTGLVGGR